jgi:hypothetical protein
MTSVGFVQPILYSTSREPTVQPLFIQSLDKELPEI